MNIIDFDFDNDDCTSEELICTTSTMPLSVCNCRDCRSDNEESIEYVRSQLCMGNKDAFEMMMKGV